MTLPRFLPTRRCAAILAAAVAIAVAALVAGMAVWQVGWFAAVAFLALGAALVGDALRSSSDWRRADVRYTRTLPSAFALGVRRPVAVALENSGDTAWECSLYDHADPTLTTEGLPFTVSLAARSNVDTEYAVTPTVRGNVRFAPADVRVRSRFGLCELVTTLGEDETRRVYPDFAPVSRYAWLAGNRRLQEIGIKTYQQRGQGTDFKQLAEYRPGDSVRHIDWRATLRLAQPIVRQFQDDRDQAVLLLLDCGRRMRAEETDAGGKGGHFDHVLNAVMLLTYVALKQGDAVGALTCGAPEGKERAFAPRKGAHALNAMMSELYDVQPSLVHADYLAAAEDVLRRHPKRALVILITNFRGEDSTELKRALRLLRSRHLVLVASMRERIIEELASRPMVDAESTVAVASAHLYEQSRRRAFLQLATRDLLTVDVPPERLGVELVNRYHAVKRAGLL